MVRKLIPVIAQDAATQQVLMLGWANKQALRATRRTGLVHFWSRSRRRLWKKGETSGNVLRLESLHRDCDGDAILVRVHPRGPVCHRGTPTCFADAAAAPSRLSQQLRRVFGARRRRPTRRSFTAHLLTQPEELARKLLEEASELAMALKQRDRGGAVAEAADLLYLIHVALFALDARFEDAEAVLRERRRAAR